MDSTLYTTSSFNDRYDLYIFDLDGTLYDQSKLRKIMRRKLISGILSLKIPIRHLRIIRDFRRERENHKSYASESIETDQYQWVSSRLQIDTDHVRKVIEHYIHELPLKNLYRCQYPGIREFFRELRRCGKLIAIHSDYPVSAKLAALELEADATVSATDHDLRSLKPNKTGPLLLCNKFNIAPESAIFIGDRKDTDGASAAAAGIDFLQVDVARAARGDFYPELTGKIRKLI